MVRSSKRRCFQYKWFEGVSPPGIAASRIALILMLSLLMSACAAPAKRDNMSIDATTRANYQPDHFLSSRVSVGSVDGGEETNPMWTSEIGNSEFEAALRDSLETSKLLNSPALSNFCLLYTSPSPRDQRGSRMPSSA